MKIKSSEFIISAVKREQYPDDNLPEIAFVGRSNVGKSSIINSLTNRRGLAEGILGCYNRKIFIK